MSPDAPAVTSGPTPAGRGLADIGVVGLAVMGSNLARNLARNGYTVAVHNRTPGRTRELLAAHGDEGAFVACATVPDLVASLARPRTVLVMVKAGDATDAVVEELARHLEPGDIVVDGGNAHFLDTARRERDLAARGLHLVGAGISGGEEGALTGPSIMPGGSEEAYATLGPMLERISAHVDGVPCCTHIGPDGAGHYVKMVHNGIEYADMQLIAEAYDVLRQGLGLSAPEIGEVVAGWSTGDLDSYLVEITAQVLAHVDAETGRPFVDVVADAAEQKGTGRWTVQSALDLGVPVTGIAEATFARALSGSAPQRAAAREAGLAARTAGWDVPDTPEGRAAFVEDVRRALYASKVVAYSQGFDQLAAASAEHGWDIDRGACARIWRGGCIIRARFLDRITQAYERDPELELLIADPVFAAAVGDGVASWRRVVAQATLNGVPVPAFAASLAYYDGVRAASLPASLIQAQRDLFGAHTYRRTDRPGVFHTEWSGDRSETRVDA
ncbi:6-phosphogluconate dehydrogenase (decarboxylating) [Salana multivorans]|uniref:6-phosphogluconate dehydrogenase, decarboxylating n=1 Tax=Salana multivorans TaxID=120377 RepID=A0A3N2DD81_9MICO|nr:NADP-dependent phosphogluconate dehydrogenase [Salana multivorans]ROR97755.1 6-phosphogluconate dehydrogenase (decarboxylating) [Salana multivorans]